MSKLQLLRAFVRDRLIAAVDEIFEAVERTVADYEEFSSARGLHNQNQCLNVDVTSEIKLSPAEPQQDCEQQRSPNLDWANPEPPQIKEEQQELCIIQEKSFHGLEQDEDAKGSVLSSCVESEDDHVQTQSNAIVFGDNVGTLEEQMQIQIDERTLCCRVYEYDEGINRNDQDHTSNPNEENPHKCSECGKEFNNPSLLKCHMRIHRNAVFHSCTICAKRWKSKSLLEIHMRAHTGERPFRCKICPFSSSQNGHLKTHMRTHTGERPYACTECGKRFTQNSNLRTHMKLHTGGKPCKPRHRRFLRS